MGSEPTEGVVEDLPATCLRSLRKVDWLTGSVVLAAAFHPDTRTADDRPDGGAEVSVNWEDDHTVESKALAEFPLAAHGLARLARAEVKRLNGVPGCIEALLCERHAQPGNPHHGNVVFRRGLSKQHTAMIAAALAVVSTHVPTTRA
jgi:hypothetical protein